MNAPPIAQRSNAPAELKRAKEKARLAFLAYEAAVRDGDHAAAEAAKSRFLAASDEMKGRKGNG